MKLIKKLTTVALMLIGFALSAFAQAPVTVKGIVLDDTAQPVIGAAVFEKGNSANGVVTGLDGDFVI